MRIRSIEKADREFFIDRCHAFYRTPACDHEIPQQNAERTFELLMHGTPYADCLIAEDDTLRVLPARAHLVERGRRPVRLAR